MFITRSSGCASVSGRERHWRMRVPEGPIPLSSGVCIALAREKADGRLLQLQSISAPPIPVVSDLSCNVHRDVDLISQAGKLKYYSRLLPWPSWPYALRTLIHHRRLCPKSIKATAIRFQSLLDPRKSSCHRRCSTYTACYPFCSMYEIPITCLS